MTEEVLEELEGGIYRETDDGPEDEDTSDKFCALTTGDNGEGDVRETVG